MNIVSDLTFTPGAKINNLPVATAPGQPVVFEQLGGGSSITSVTLDFGSTPVFSKQFSFTVSGALLTQNVLISPSAKMPLGVDLDELEMDSINVAAYVSAANTISVLAVASPGPIVGQRNFNYQIS